MTQERTKQWVQCIVENETNLKAFTQKTHTHTTENRNEELIKKQFHNFAYIFIAFHFFSYWMGAELTWKNQRDGIKMVYIVSKRERDRHNH